MGKSLLESWKMLGVLFVIGICEWTLLVAFSVLIFTYYEEKWRSTRRNKHQRRKAGGTFRLWTLPTIVCEGILFIVVGSSILADKSCLFSEWRLAIIQAVVPLVTFSFILLTLRLRGQWKANTSQGGLETSLAWKSWDWVKVFVPAMIPMVLTLVIHWSSLRSAWSLQLFFWMTVLYVVSISAFLSYYSYHLFPHYRNRARPEGGQGTFDFRLLQLRLTLAVCGLSVLVGLTMSTLLITGVLVISSCTLHFLFMTSGAVFALTVELMILDDLADLCDVFSILGRPCASIGCFQSTVVSHRGNSSKSRNAGLQPESQQRQTEVV